MTFRTKSGSSWSSYEKFSWYGELKSSRVTTRWIFKKIDELTARIQELQNKVCCIDDSRDFKDAESVRSGRPHVPSQPALLPPYRDAGWLPSSSVGMLSDTHGISGNVFANPSASSSSPYPRGFNPLISDVTEDTLLLTNTGRPVTCGEHQIPDTVLTPRFQPGPSAGNSFDPKEERFLNSSGADQRQQISELHFNTICLLEDKIQKLRYVLVHNFCQKLCFGSKKWRWLNQWMIKNLRALFKGIRMPDFEVLNAKIASALHKIIHNARFKKKVSLEE